MAVPFVRVFYTNGSGGVWLARLEPALGPSLQEVSRAHPRVMEVGTWPEAEDHAGARHVSSRARPDVVATRPNRRE